MNPTDCKFDPLGTGVHSDDRVIIYHGVPTPLEVCGYHAEFWTPTEIRTGLAS